MPANIYPRLQRHDTAGSGGARGDAAVFGRVWGNPSRSITRQKGGGRCWTMRATGRRNFRARSRAKSFSLSGGTESNNLAIFGTRRAAQIQRQAFDHEFGRASRGSGLFQLSRKARKALKSRACGQFREGRVSPDDCEKPSAKTRFWFPFWRRIMKSERCNRSTSARFVTNTEFLFTRTRWQWLGKAPLKMSRNPRGFGIRLLRAQFHGQKVRVCYG